MSSLDMPEENTDAKSFESNVESLLESVSDAKVNSRTSFEEFTDERMLISSDAFGKNR